MPNTPTSDVLERLRQQEREHIEHIEGLAADGYFTAAQLVSQAAITVNFADFQALLATIERLSAERPTEAMLLAGQAELGKWLGKNPADIDDLVPASIWAVMRRAALTEKEG